MTERQERVIRVILIAAIVIGLLAVARCTEQVGWYWTP